MKVGDFVHITRKENGAKSRMDPEDVALMQARIPHTGIVVYIHPVGHWATVLCMSDSGKALYCETFRAKELNVMRPPKDGRAMKEVLAWSAKGYGLIPLPTETQ